MCRHVCLLLAAMLVIASRSYADEDELQPTTEFGITIVADQIYDAIQETQDFWSPVRHQIVNAPYIGADDATRKPLLASRQPVLGEGRSRVWLVEAGDDDVVRKVQGDLTAGGVSKSTEEIRAKMSELLAVAADQIENA